MPDVTRYRRNSLPPALSHDRRLIESRLWAADETLTLLLSCHPHAADLVRLICSDHEAVRMVLAWHDGPDEGEG
jgi:hypothetical protein